MKPYWTKSVHITASITEKGRVGFSIHMGLTGPIIVMTIGDESVVVASRWKTYITDHGIKQLVEALGEGMAFLEAMEEK